MTDTLNVLFGLVVLLVLLALYLLPFIVANNRRLANRGSIFFLNLFLGWTLVGWVVSLCWAVAGTAEVERE